MCISSRSTAHLIITNHRLESLLSKRVALRRIKAIGVVATVYWAITLQKYIRQQKISSTGNSNREIYSWHCSRIHERCQSKADKKSVYNVFSIVPLLTAWNHFAIYCVCQEQTTCFRKNIYSLLYCSLSKRSYVCAVCDTEKFSFVRVQQFLWFAGRLQVFINFRKFIQ